MKPEEIEDLYLRSLDGSLNEIQKRDLEQALKANEGLVKALSKYDVIREKMRNDKADTFGPYFAQKVVYKIQNMRAHVDQEIGFFFKKFQLAAIGIVIALVAINVIFSDELNIQSVLGIQDEAAADDSEEVIEAFDFSSNLTNNQ